VLSMTRLLFSCRMLVPRCRVGRIPCSSAEAKGTCQEAVVAYLVAISVVMAVGNCGVPQILLGSGRVDATGPGSFGDPAPDTEISRRH
jgi:hypothetical protein